MTFDDGILKIYELENDAEPGRKPAPRLVFKSQHYYAFETVGMQRYYTAKQAMVEVSDRVSIWQDRNITTQDICVLEDGKQYQCEQVQHLTDEAGLKITKITLERLGKDYVVSEH